MTSGDIRRAPLTYLLPLRADAPVADELADYVKRIADDVDDLVVVDGSELSVFAAHAARWQGAPMRHVPVAASVRAANGKVRGVLTGLALARHDAVVIADDDVRHDAGTLAALLHRLATSDAVVPANYFDPLTWHARYDTARILVHRALGGDFPGTLAVRRSVLASAGGGYDGDVLFENLELLRTIEALSGRVEWALDVFVPRRPPDVRHFLGQRARQAYDELARPSHLLPSLAVLPLLLTVAVRAPALLPVAAAAAVLEAEVGRRRGGGATRFPASSCLLAPLWVLERGACMWLALWWRARGGVPYAGVRLRRAASSRRELRRRYPAPGRSVAAEGGAHG